MDWFTPLRAANKEVNGQIMLEVAKQIVRRLGAGDATRIQCLCDKCKDVKANLKLVTLPKNTTAKLHACDEVVIRSLKANYRGKLSRLILNKDAKSVSNEDG